MARTKKESPARIAIIQAACDLFLEIGFSKTTAATLCKKLDIGTGNLTFYFPTKEHILDVLVAMQCDFQWKVIEAATDEGASSLLAYCLELTAMAAISEQDERMHDFYVSAYSHPMTLESIRTNDLEKVKKIFGEYCKDWSEEQFIEAEAMVSGIEYATLMTTQHSASLPVRICGALNTIMQIFNVPSDLRKEKIDKVLALDYRAIGDRICRDFKDYVVKTNEKAIDDMLESYRIKRS